jgi:hypothetical protein
VARRGPSLVGGMSMRRSTQSTKQIAVLLEHSEHVPSNKHIHIIRRIIIRQQML